MRALRFLDLGVLALALPLFLIAHLPMAGYGVAAGSWLFQRGVRELVGRRAEAADEMRMRVGLTAASMIVRGWLVAFAIFAIGLRDSHAGLAAAVLFLVLFTISFTMEAVLRPIGQPAPAKGRSR